MPHVKKMVSIFQRNDIIRRRVKKRYCIVLFSLIFCLHLYPLIAIVINCFIFFALWMWNLFNVVVDIILLRRACGGVGGGRGCPYLTWNEHQIHIECCRCSPSVFFFHYLFNSDASHFSFYMECVPFLELRLWQIRLSKWVLC